jgi:hypothetical protein
MKLPDWLIDIGKLAIIIIVLSNILLFCWLITARLYRKWRIHKLKRGLINYLGLTDWFSSLTPKKQGLFKKYYANVANVPSTVDRLTDADIYSASETPSQLLVMIAASSMMNNDFTFADKLLLKANSEAKTPWEKQQVLLAYSFLFFKQRNQLSGARENCMIYSQKAIRSIERFGVSDDQPPTLPYDQLITLSEESKNYQKGIEITLKAINLFGRRHADISTRFAKKKKELEEKIRES